MLKAALALAGAAVPYVAWTQIVPTVPEVDFGAIMETEGPKTVRMYVRNDGTAPELLLKVRPTCGCTAADFMQGEVAPGDSAWIDLTYDPSRRPGRFEKGVKIYSVPSGIGEEEPRLTRVPISGTVFASPETVGAMFPVDAGLLRLSEDRLMTLSPLDSRERSLFIDVYNTGDRPVAFRVDSQSEAISSRSFPELLPPGEKGMAGIYLDPAKENRKGHLEYGLTLVMDDGQTIVNHPVTLISEK